MSAAPFSRGEPGRPKYRVVRNLVDVTRCGMFGGNPDSCREFEAGPWRYFRDDVEITRDEYESRPVT